MIQGLQGSDLLLLEFMGGFLSWDAKPGELLGLHGAGAKGGVLRGRMENKAWTK